ncbi:unnamed protein product [Prorocentrum cordatum]|uniref:Uncharacterized protein n=1 Tax=Prorocentrum cordatum TaxID=2364126 RepID=A0ABN9SI76_9DINO|nr:unnamed protein product [Polarella glacialis]
MAELRAPGVCPEGPPGAFEVTAVGLRTRSWDADEQLLADLGRYIRHMRNQSEWPEELARSFESAHACLEKLAHVDAKDVLALQETWTEADTDVLRRLDPYADGFVEGELDTEAFRQRLPSAGQFADIVQERAFAMVGASDSLLEKRPGPEIDAHEVVVRFNDHVKDNLDEAVTGTKTTMHVTCDASGPMGDDGVTEFDLETRAPWSSYCNKMNINGVFYHPNITYYIMRPTALCAMDSEFSFFTRGFMFYWLVGRLFDQPDMYGFDGDAHYDNNQVVWESFLHFEHAVYRLVRGELEIPADVEPLDAT